MLHLQGDLQVVFDALYELGVIEPVLKMDWKPCLEEVEEGSPRLEHAIEVVNGFSHDRKRLVAELKKLEWHDLEVLAMEVAREYADFHTRQSLQ